MPGELHERRKWSYNGSHMKTHAQLALMIVLLTFLFPQRAEAYLDPGTGSIILQALIGGILGGLIALKASWQKVAGFFNKNKRALPPKEEKTTPSA